jgi:hypothetical protein
LRRSWCNDNDEELNVSDYTDPTKKANNNKKPRRRQAATDTAIRNYLHRQAMGRHRNWAFRPQVAKETQ